MATISNIAGLEKYKYINAPTLMLKNLVHINFWLFYGYSRVVFSCNFMHYKTMWRVP